MLSKLLLGNEKNIKRSSVIWNSIGGALNAGQVAIMLIFISYKLGHTIAGMVTIAYAIANLCLAAGKYGIRTFQVTDVEDHYSFGDYFRCRIITVFSVMAIAALYLVFCRYYQSYSIEKVFIVCEVIVLKLIDAFEDVFLGRFQQKGRLDIGAKILAFQCFLYTSCICILVLLGFNIHICLMGGIGTSVVFGLILIYKTYTYLKIEDFKSERSHIFSMLKECISLCVGITLSIYVGNIPKYLIDAYMDEHTQAIFGYIMMPVFVVTLLNQFIYQPTIKDLGDLWNKGRIKDFKKKVLRQCLIVLVLMIIITVGGLIVGLPILSIMYHTNLSKYRMEFALLLIGGSLYALAFYLNVPITTIRKQKYIAVGYILASILSLVFGKWFVNGKGILGASLLYLFINMILVVLYVFCVLLEINRMDKKLSDNGLRGA